MPFDTIAGRKVEAHRPFPRIVVGEDGWRFVAGQLSAGILGAARPVGRQRRRAHGRARRERPATSRSSASNARMPDFLRLARCIRRPFAWSGLCATSSDSSRWACPIRAPGSTSASGTCAPARRSVARLPPPQRCRMNSCRAKAKACIRSRSGRCTRASSSPATSALPPTAKPWCGSSSVWATCTRASRR